MSKTQSRPAPQQQSVQNAPQDADAAALLEKILEQQPSQRYRAIDAALQKRIDKVEELLPDQMKGQGARLVKRALLTFSKNPRLQEVTPESFIRCVLEAAELGLAIDGKLCHAVPYDNRVKVRGPDGRERDEWRKEAQCQPDFKGIIAVAKRTGRILDCKADVVCENDQFVHGRSGPHSRLEHSFDERAPRGDVIAAYVIITLPGGAPWQYDLMQRKELDEIMGRSKSFQAFKAGKVKSTPWANDTNEMRKKTVIKRGLKTYLDDPGLVRALEIDDEDYGDHQDRTPHKRVSISPLNQSLGVPVAPKQSTFETPTPTHSDASYEPTEDVSREPGDDGADDMGEPGDYVEGPDGELLFKKSEGVGQ